MLVILSEDGKVWIKHDGQQNPGISKWSLDITSILDPVLRYFDIFFAVFVVLGNPSVPLFKCD